jgi:hypothetical protein
MRRTDCCEDRIAHRGYILNRDQRIVDTVRIGSLAPHGKKGAGTENAKHPLGRSGFRYLTPGTWSC